MKASFLEQESGVAFALPAYAAMKDAQAQLGQLTQSWLDIRGKGSPTVCQPHSPLNGFEIPLKGFQACVTRRAVSKCNPGQPPQGTDV